MLEQDEPLISTIIPNWQSKLHDECRLMMTQNVTQYDIEQINRYRYKELTIMFDYSNGVDINVYTKTLNIIHCTNRDYSNIKATATYVHGNVKLNTEYTKYISCDEACIRNNSCGSIVFATVKDFNPFAVWLQLVAYNDGDKIILNPNHPHSHLFPTTIDNVLEAIQQYESDMRRILHTKSAR